MKQWDVSREFRRRFKLAIEASDTEIPFPQRDVWLHPSDKLLRGLQGGDRHSVPDPAEQNGKRMAAVTHHQSRNVPEGEDAEDGDAYDGD